MNDAAFYALINVLGGLGLAGACVTFTFQWQSRKILKELERLNRPVLPWLNETMLMLWFQGRIDQCNQYASDHRAAHNELSAEYHRGAAEAFKVALRRCVGELP